jgi:hypothetical protein
LGELDLDVEAAGEVVAVLRPALEQQGQGPGEEQDADRI